MKFQISKLKNQVNNKKENFKFRCIKIEDVQMKLIKRQNKRSVML